MELATVERAFKSIHENGFRFRCVTCNEPMISASKPKRHDQYCSRCRKGIIDKTEFNKRLKECGVPAKYLAQHACLNAITDVRVPSYDIINSWPMTVSILIKEQSKGPRSLCIYGGSGTGKSTIAAYLARDLMKMGLNGRWLVEDEIISTDRGGSREIFNAARSVQLLVIDDMLSMAGSMAIVDRAIATLNALLTHRYGDTRKITIITTDRIIGPRMARQYADEKDLDYDELLSKTVAMIAPAIYSRLKEGLIVHTGNSDKRNLDLANLPITERGKQ